MTFTLQKILVPTDFSEHAAGALQAAESLARPSGATLHLLHVVQMPVVPIMPEAAPVVPVSFWQELREHALLGSVAERTVRSAPCPVLTVKKGGPLRIRRIVVAMDFSAAARRALELAQSLAKGAGPAHVILVHAYYVPVELEQYLITHGKSIPDVLSPEATRDLEAILTKLQKDGLSAEYVAAAGAPETVVLEVAKDKQADLIALGTHGRRGISHMLLGSVAERIVRHAEIPVVTVRG